MQLRIKGSDIKPIFTDYAKNAKTMFNFKCNGDTLSIQVLEDFIIETEIACEVIDSFSDTDISVYVTKAVNILSEKEDVIFELVDAALTIMQGSFSYVLIREYEARADLPVIDDSLFKEMYVGQLKYTTVIATKMLSLAQELQINAADPIFMSGNVYIIYKATVFVMNMDFPSCAIGLSILRALVYRLDKGALFYNDEERNRLVFKSGAYTMWVPTTNYNKLGNMTSAIDSKLRETSEIGYVNIHKYADQFSVIADNFKKQTVSLSIGKNQIAIGIQSSTMHISIGDSILVPIATMTITTANLSCLIKIFKEDELVQVLRGGNCLCFKVDNKSLLIAGMLY